jgi:hypothetical protein
LPQLAGDAAQVVTQVLTMRAGGDVVLPPPDVLRRVAAELLRQIQAVG